MRATLISALYWVCFLSILLTLWGWVGFFPAMIILLILCLPATFIERWYLDKKYNK